MHDIRNPTGRLVCRVDPANAIIEIYIKGFLTCIQWIPEGSKVRVTHSRKTLSA